MQIPIKKFRQSSTVFEKPGNLSENYSSIFFAETSQTFPTYQRLQKAVWNFFYFA